ncbi:MAG: acyltransferase [Pseudomonadota bacterium]
MKLHSIQMLRAIAALLVLGFHIRAVQADTIAELTGEPRIFATWPILENGYAGVDLFFVISGFIMVLVTGSGQRGPGASGVFLLSRAVRIYPIWWLFAGVMAAYMLVTYGAVNSGAGGWADLAGSVPVPEYLWKSFLLVPQEGYPVLSVGWTLVHEMYFYAVFAVTLLFARRWLWVFLLAWAGLVVGFALAGYSRPLALSIPSLAVHPMTLEFIAGAFAGLAVCSGRRLAPVALALLSLAWLVAALILSLPADQIGQLEGGWIAIDGYQFSLITGENWSTFVLEWGRVIVFGPPCALLVYALASLDVEKRIVIPRALSILGDWSYALYLSHILVLVAIARVFPDLAAGPYFALAAVPAALIIAGLTYTLLERPLMAVFNAWRRETFSAEGPAPRPARVAARIW